MQEASHAAEYCALADLAEHDIDGFQRVVTFFLSLLGFLLCIPDWRERVCLLKTALHHDTRLINPGDS